jgi:glycine cleavage system H protein
MNPKDCKYTKDHEWVKVIGKKATVGVTAFAAQQLGDVVFVQLPEGGSEVTKGKTIGVIESVKTVSDMYAPVSGTVTKKNDELSDSPELINSDAFGKGWIAEIEMSNPGDVNDLMDASAYEDHCAKSGH